MANKYESLAKKCKVVILEWKFKSDINGVIEEIADCKNVHMSTILYIFSKRNLVKGNLSTKIRNIIAVKKMELFQRRYTGKKVHIKGTLGDIL